MTAPASLLLVWLSMSGYWMGSAPAAVSLTWNLPDQPIAQARVTWQLSVGPVVLTEGHTLLERDGPTRVSLNVPRVRARTAATWHYRLIASDPDRVLASAMLPVVLFPDDLLTAAVPALRKMPVAVWDAGLAETLAKAGYSVRALQSPDDLTGQNPTVILVGPHALDDHTPSAQERLAGHAQAGATVIVLPQGGPAHVLGYPLTPRSVRRAGTDGVESPSPLRYRLEHPLLAGLAAADLERLSDLAGDCQALTLPADEAALEVIYFGGEPAAKKPAAIDALLTVKTTGQGRLILIQLPLESWSADPRGLILLRNALLYALGPVTATPRPSERSVTPQPSLPVLPSIPVRSGDRP